MEAAMWSCPICQVDDAEDPLCSLRCEHSVCRSCFLKMLHFDLRCPMCRVVITGTLPAVDCPVSPPTLLRLSASSDRGRRAMPIWKDGSIVVSKGRRIAPFRKGDVVQTMNGMPMASARCARQLLAADTDLEVGVRRKPKPLFFSRVFGRRPAPPQ